MADSSITSGSATTSQLKSLTIKNFKRFSTLEIPLSDAGESTVLMGPNGAGKTQILYALLLYFRAYNLAYSGPEKSERRILAPSDNTVPKPHLSLIEEARTLFHPSLTNDFSHFIRDKSKESFATLTGNFKDGSTVSTVLYANGVFAVVPNEEHRTNEKIHYGYAGTEFHFNRDAEDRILPLTTHFPHIRLVHSALTNDSKAKIVEHVQHFFPDIERIESSKERYGPAILKIYERVFGTTVSVDPVAMGSAFQKVFATLTLFYALLELHMIESTEKLSNQRFFLMEEPEALLYPSLVAEFFGLINSLCKQHLIRLFVVSNSPDVWIRAKHRYLISMTDDGKLAVPHLKEMKAIFGTPFPPPSNKPILIVDGKHDKAFLRAFTNWAHHTSIYRKGALKLGNNKQYVIDILKESGSSFAFLSDSEFAHADLLEQDHYTVHWSLPCIVLFDS